MGVWVGVWVGVREGVWVYGRMDGSIEIGGDRLTGMVRARVYVLVFTDMEHMYEWVPQTVPVGAWGECEYEGRGPVCSGEGKM